MKEKKLRYSIFYGYEKDKRQENVGFWWRKFATNSYLKFMIFMVRLRIEGYDFVDIVIRKEAHEHL